MRIAFLIPFFLLFLACKESNKTPISKKEEVSFEQKQLALEKIGQIYYERNCIKCHGKRGVKDQLLEYAIKADKYEFDFIKAYVTNQDSLIKNGNKIALGLKDWSNQDYLHRFDVNDNEIKAIIYYLKK
ncbi:MAG: c-type cytochrome [Gelidibacter sp.]